MKKKAFASIYNEISLEKGVDAPTRILLLRNGENAREENNIKYYLNDAQKVIENSMASIDKMFVDYDHVTDMNTLKGKGGNSPAAAWFTDLLSDEVGIWGVVEWVADGAKAVASKSYRFISPVFSHDKVTGEVLGIIRASLTNTPALHLKALASQSDLEDEIMDYEEAFKALLKALGLDETADQETALASIQKLESNEDKAKVVAVALASLQEPLGIEGDVDVEKVIALCSAKDGEIKTLQTTVEDRDAAITELTLKLKESGAAMATASIEAKVDDAIKSGKIFPAQRGWAIALCQKDQKQFDELVSVTPGIGLGPSGANGNPPKKSDGSHALTESQKAICAQIGVSEETYLKSLEKGGA